MHPIQTKTASPVEWAQAACDALMAKYTPEQLPPAGRWHYHQGIFLHGMLQMWESVRDDKYVSYAKEYVDKLIDADGNFYFARDELDAIMPGLLLFPLEDRFGERRYGIAIRKLRSLLHTLNKTSEGGYWHKDKYPYQMWLDGLYMGSVFAVRYAVRYGEPELIETALDQEQLMRKHMKDETSGLLYHAWDESRGFPWADPVTGCSPEFWGRSLGWYGMALVDILDSLPNGHAGRGQIERAAADFVKALVRFQESESGLWYQVVDKGERPDNWLETSCTSLFVYTIAKAVLHGCAGQTEAAAAWKGYEGLIRRVRTDEAGLLVVPDICIGTSAGEYDYYAARPVSENDLHGVGAFVLACMAVDGLNRG